LIFGFQPFTNKSLHVQLHTQLLLTFLSSLAQRFLNISRFSPLFSTLGLQNLQLGYNCTIAIWQLQITFYNFRTCHVKICPDH